MLYLIKNKKDLSSRRVSEVTPLAFLLSMVLASSAGHTRRLRGLFYF